MTKVLFIEDHDGYYNRLKNLFEEHHIVAKGLRNYAALEKQLVEYQPQMIFLDIHINEDSNAGMEALKRVRKNPKFDEIKAVMLTHDSDKIKEAFLLGADGYVCKEDVHKNIELFKILMDDYPVTNQAIESLIQDVRPPIELKRCLARREAETLLYAAQDMTVPKIADKMGLAIVTIEGFMKNIRGKLRCHTVQGAVAKAICGRLIDTKKIILDF